MTFCTLKLNVTESPGSQRQISLHHVVHSQLLPYIFFRRTTSKWLQELVLFCLLSRQFAKFCFIAWLNLRTFPTPALHSVNICTCSISIIDLLMPVLAIAEADHSRSKSWPRSFEYQTSLRFFWCEIEPFLLVRISARLLRKYGANIVTEGWKTTSKAIHSFC